MYNNVEDHGSGQKTAAVGQAIIFAVYIVALTILAILAVPVFYFVGVAVLGLPATGILQHIKQENQAKRWVELEKAKYQPQSQPQQTQQTADPSQGIQVYSATDSAGNPVIHL